MPRSVLCTQSVQCDHVPGAWPVYASSKAPRIVPKVPEPSSKVCRLSLVQTLPSAVHRPSQQVDAEQLSVSQISLSPEQTLHGALPGIVRLTRTDVQLPNLCHTALHNRIPLYLLCVTWDTTHWLLCIRENPEVIPPISRPRLMADNLKHAPSLHLSWETTLAAPQRCHGVTHQLPTSKHRSGPQ